MNKIHQSSEWFFRDYVLKVHGGEDTHSFTERLADMANTYKVITIPATSRSTGRTRFEKVVLEAIGFQVEATSGVAPTLSELSSRMLDFTTAIRGSQAQMVTADEVPPKFPALCPRHGIEMRSGLCRKCSR